MTDGVLNRAAAFLEANWDTPPDGWPTTYRSTPQFPRRWPGVRLALALHEAQGIAPGLSLFAFIEWREATAASARLREQLTLVASDLTGRPRRDPFVHVADLADAPAALSFLQAAIDRFGEPDPPTLTLRPGLTNSPSSALASKRARVVMLSLATLHHLTDEPLGSMLVRATTDTKAALSKMSDWDLLAWSDDQVGDHGWPDRIPVVARDRYRDIATAFTESWRDHPLTGFLALLGGPSLAVATDDEFLAAAASRPKPLAV